MCKRKPGRRCPNCRSRVLAAQAGKVRRINDALTASKPGTPAHAELVKKRTAAGREYIVRQTDLDSTAEGRTALAEEIDQRLAVNPRDKQVPDLARRLIAGRMLEGYRREQERAMPPLPAARDSKELHKELGDARYDLACCKTRMDMNGANTPEWEHWARRHYEAAESANLAAAKLRAVEQSNDSSAWSTLSAQQRNDVRAQIAQEDPSLSTPAAPRSLESALHDYADRADGTEPIPDDLAHLAHPPYKPDPAVSGQAHSTRTTDSGDDAGEGDGKATGAPAARPPRQLATQRRQRKGRLQAARAELRQVKSRSQRLHPDRLAGKADVDLGEMNGAGDGPPPDPTGLFLLFELLPGQ